MDCLDVHRLDVRRCFGHVDLALRCRIRGFRAWKRELVCMRSLIMRSDALSQFVEYLSMADNSTDDGEEEKAFAVLFLILTLIVIIVGHELRRVLPPAVLDVITLFGHT